MNTISRASLLCAALLGLAVVAVRADPPATGKVLLLENQRTLEGDIERQGDQYVIRKGGGEMTLSADRVLHLCASWDDAFAFMQSQANLHDPDEHLRLARWCELNSLHGRAIDETNRALAMRPNHLPTKQYLATLQKTPGVTAQPAAQQVKAGPDAAPPVIDLSAECLALFNTRIQPILMNTCATCHASGKGGDFKLLRCEDATVNRRAVQFNLAAVVGQIDFERPEVSPLLVKSFSKHGNATQAPLQGRDSIPFQMLQAWVKQTVQNNPHLHREPVKVAVAPPVVAPSVHQPATPAPGAQFAVGNVSQPPAPVANVQPTPPGTPQTVQFASTAPTTVVHQDEFSEVHYNSKWHPGR
jgi:hypothetical protein